MIKQLQLSIAALAMAGMAVSCSELNNAWTGMAPQLTKTLPPPASVAGGSIKIQTSSEYGENWETIKMKSNNSGTVTGYDSTEAARYTVIDGRAYLYLSYTELKPGMIKDAPRIFTYTIDDEAETWESPASPRSASINIQSVKGKEYYGVLNGYLHNQYSGTAERLRNVPIIIKVK